MNTLDKYGTYKITVKHSHMEKRDDGSMIRVEDPAKEHEVELLMDSTSIIHRLGARAVLNKGKAVKYLHGALVIREVSK